MRFDIVFVLLALVAVREATCAKIQLPKEIEDLLANLGDACASETGVDKSVVEEMRKAKLSDDPKAKCYLKCMMMQLQAMKEDGSLDIDLIDATLPDEIKKHGGMETVKKCKDTKGDDLCDTAYKLMSCFQKENPTLTSMFE